MDRPPPHEDGDLAQALREAAYYRRIAEEAGSRRLREAEALNRLLERAEEAERQLERARDELERRVEERTAALSSANERLRREAEERAREEAERRRLELQMEQLQRTESLGVLAGGIAHDFNNLLATILANVAVLRAEGAACEEAPACLADVEEAARTAAGLCQRMLAYAGRAPFTTELLDLGGLVRDLVQLLRASLSRKVGLELRLGEELPLVRGDPSQLRQVVMNLVINAAEAVGDGEGTVTVSTGAEQVGPERLRAALLGREEAAGPHLFLEVGDTGCGMDPETQRRIFEPFFSSKFAGRGLGLSAVLGIVRQLGGAIELESAPGRGTRFRVLLPAAAAGPRAARAAPAPSAWTGEGLVLVVDDEPAVRRAAGRLLERIGFGMLEAAGGAEGVELYTARAAEVRAVLLDLTMPHQDGVETFHRLRQVDPAVRAVVASGYDESEVRLRFGADQPAGIVQKPFDLEELRGALRALLEGAPAAAR